MFTGLIEEVGTITAVEAPKGGRRLTLRGGRVMDDLKIDDSIAIDGCCQTVVARNAETFSVVAVEETLRKTTLGDLREGSRVNLERALRVGDRLGGHFVMGHVDCVGLVAEKERLESSMLYWISYPEEFARLVIPVGSVAINGVSLTAARVEGNRCMVSIIPHTMEATTFRDLERDARVNLEFDMLGKYLENLVGAARGASFG